MAYAEMVLLVLVAIIGLVLLALAVSSGPVHHLHATSRDRTLPPAALTRVRTPQAPAPRTRTGRRHAATRCDHQADGWTRLMEPSGSGPSGDRRR